MVDQGGVLLEDLVATGTGGVLELEYRLRVEQVHLALAAPLVLAADRQLTMGSLGGPIGVGVAMTGENLLCHDAEADPSEPAGSAGEVLVDHWLCQSDGLEDLCSGVGGHRRDAHLGHDLEHALRGGLGVVLVRLTRADPLEQAGRDHVVDRVEGHVRVHRAGSEADEERHVVDLTGVTALDDQADLGPLLMAHEVLVDSSGQQQRRDGCELDRRIAI